VTFTLTAYSLLALVAIGLLAYVISIFNQLVMLRLNIDKAFHNIDILLKQRTDEIPQLVIIVKQAMQYEQQTLEKLTQLRNQFFQTTKTEQKTQVSNEISQIIHGIFGVVESYPNLKTNENMLGLQKRISEIENAIADRMEFFNDSVTLYNIAINEFPNLILAKLLLYRDKSLLKLDHKNHGIQF
jgi:LemA protein